MACAATHPQSLRSREACCTFISLAYKQKQTQTSTELPTTLSYKNISLLYLRSILCSLRVHLFSYWTLKASVTLKNIKINSFKYQNCCIIFVKCVKVSIHNTFKISLKKHKRAQGIWYKSEYSGRWEMLQILHRHILTLAPSKPGAPACPRSPWKNNNKTKLHQLIHILCVQKVGWHKQQ